MVIAPLRFVLYSRLYFRWLAPFSSQDGGKQINRIQSGAFQHRCMAAGLCLSLGPGWIAQTWETLFGSCSSITSAFFTNRKRKHESDVKRKVTHTYKKARIEAKYHLGPAATTDSCYGPMQHSLT